MKRTIYISHNEVDCALDAHGTLEHARQSIENQLGPEDMKECKWIGGRTLIWKEDNSKVAHIYLREVEFSEEE